MRTKWVYYILLVLSNNGRYIQRLTPISHLSHATEAAFEALCGMICQSHLSKDDEEGKGRKVCSQQFYRILLINQQYRIELGKRSHNTLKRDDIIQTVVDSINLPHKIDLSNPDRWVIVEIFKGVAGVSVVSEYDKYRKFNPFSLIEAKNKGEDKRDELQNFISVQSMVLLSTLLCLMNRCSSQLVLQMQRLT